MKRNLKKISVTLPPELVADLDYVSGRLGVSRSALIAHTLPEALGFMRGLLVDVPENPTPDDVIQFRGSSADLIRDRIEHLKGMADDLFSAK